jgi:hypothetical protein
MLLCKLRSILYLTSFLTASVSFGNHSASLLKWWLWSKPNSLKTPRIHFSSVPRSRWILRFIPYNFSNSCIEVCNTPDVKFMNYVGCVWCSDYFLSFTAYNDMRIFVQCILLLSFQIHAQNEHTDLTWSDVTKCQWLSYVFIIFMVSRNELDGVPGKQPRTLEGELRDSESQFSTSLDDGAPCKEL